MGQVRTICTDCFIQATVMCAVTSALQLSLLLPYNRQEASETKGVFIMRMQAPNICGHRRVCINYIHKGPSKAASDYDIVEIEHRQNKLTCMLRMDLTIQTLGVTN